MVFRRDISFESPEDNLLFDQVLLEEAEAGHSGEMLRFWESSQYFIVLGRIGRPAEELLIERVKAERILVLRRCSGGGTVVQGAGCLNYACVLHKDGPHDVADLKRSYQYILGKVTAALKRCGIKATYLPISDIALCDNRKKISGNAQKRGRKYILHHGTLLYNYDLSRIERYLAIPASMPDYRESRPHRDFVTNASMSKLDFQDALSAEFKTVQQDGVVGVAERERLEMLRRSGSTAVIL